MGLALGGVVGTALALVSGMSRLGEDLLDATVPKVTLIALGVAFHLYLNVYAGIRGMDEQLT